MGFICVLIILAVTPLNLAFNFHNGVSTSPYIIGGCEVKPHSHPHQVLLTIQGQDIEERRCGGSLISSEWIISAAHCVINGEIIFAIVGAHDTSKDEPSQQMKLVTLFIAHPAYNANNLDNDIAVLRVEKVLLNDKVQPVRLPSWSQRDTWFWRYSAIMTGWGQDGYDSKNHFSESGQKPKPDKESVTTLQYAVSKVVTNLYCRFRHGFSKIKNFHICLDGSDGKATNKGDSGGPLVITESDGKYTLIGITFVRMNDAPGKTYPTIFTRTTSYLDWISKTTGIPIRK